MWGLAASVLIGAFASSGCPPKPAAEIPPAENLVVPDKFSRPPSRPVDAAPVVVLPMDAGLLDAAVSLSVDGQSGSDGGIDAGEAGVDAGLDAGVDR